TSSVCTSGAGTINGSTQEQQISISYDGGALRADPASMYATAIAPPADLRATPEFVLEQFINQLTRLDEQIDQLKKKIDDTEVKPDSGDIDSIGEESE
ncbi:MAG: hypothetical protein JW709_04155, partial [Sedimentisphaerales bacterium]|nr:hypothetical protein [Sedimentisphaerales bacterium]